MKVNCPVFNPTLEEFSDFEKYMEKVECESSGFGMAKIIPPPTWSAREKGYKKVCSKISHQTRQIVVGRTETYKVFIISDPETSYKSFKSYARKRELPENLPANLIERMFWRNIQFDSSVYGVSTEVSSLFDEEVLWNMENLPSVLNDGLNFEKLSGINTPVIYFGSWKTMFCWHKEDLDLYLVSFLHFGKPKFWYCIHPEDSEKFEALCQTKFADEYQACHEFLRHKSTQISSSVLKREGIKFSTIVQNPGEFIVIFSGCYHMNFNIGFNCAEAVNFALNKWIGIGANAKRCLCDQQAPFIEMEAFCRNLEMVRAERLQKKQKI